jgi:hypothetical protein
LPLLITPPAPPPRPALASRARLFARDGTDATLAFAIAPVVLADVVVVGIRRFVVNDVVVVDIDDDEDGSGLRFASQWSRSCVRRTRRADN